VKVLVVTDLVPFEERGVDLLARRLAAALVDGGHAVEVLRFPIHDRDAAELPLQFVAMRALDLANTDRVVALGFPAMLVAHPALAVWLPEPVPAIGDPEVDAVIRAAATTVLARVDSVVAGSHEVADGIARLTGVRPAVLPVPETDDVAAWADVVATVVAP
jgi:hypothetical protein